MQEACARLTTKRFEVGTGYLVAPDLLATCHHVIRDVELDEEIDCIFGNTGLLRRKAKLIAEGSGSRSDKATDTAVLRLDRPVSEIAPLPLLAGPPESRTDFWAVGFPYFAAANSEHLRPAIPFYGKINAPSQLSPEGIADTLLLEVEQFKGRVPESMGGISGSPLIVDGYVIGHISSVLGSKTEKKAPHLACAYAVRASGILRLLGREPATFVETVVAAEGPRWLEVAPALDWPIANLREARDGFAQLITRATSRRLLPIRGASETGKTLLTNQFLRNTINLVPGVSVGRFDFKGSIDMDVALADLACDLNVERPQAGNSVSSQLAHVLKLLKGAARPALLILDTFEMAGEAERWVEESLVPALFRSSWLRVVVVGQRTVGRRTNSVQANWKDICFPTIELHPPTPEDWFDYSQTHSNPKQGITLKLVRDIYPLGQVSTLAALFGPAD